MSRAWGKNRRARAYGRCAAAYRNATSVSRKALDDLERVRTSHPAQSFRDGMVDDSRLRNVEPLNLP